MKPQFIETWVDYFEVESSTGQSVSFTDFEAAEEKFEDLRKANPSASFRLLAVICES